jgi:hypothetical protein
MESAGVHRSSRQFTESLHAQEYLFLTRLLPITTTRTLRVSISAPGTPPQQRRACWGPARTREPTLPGRAWPPPCRERAIRSQARITPCPDVAALDWHARSPRSSAGLAALPPLSAFGAQRAEPRSHTRVVPDRPRRAGAMDSAWDLRSVRPERLPALRPPHDHEPRRSTPGDAPGQAQGTGGDDRGGYPQERRLPSTYAARGGQGGDTIPVQGTRQASCTR